MAPTRKKPRGTVAILTADETTAVHLYIKHGGKRGPTEIAKELGIDIDIAKAFLKQPRVASYIQSYRTTFLREMARYELAQITKYPVSRDDVIGRLHMLALTPPELTKGTIDGQVQALNAITDILGLKFSPRDGDAFFKNKTPKELENYALYGRFEGIDGNEPSEPIPAA